MAKPKKVSPDYSRNVFINCPFDTSTADPTYQPLLRAMIFAIEDCGYRVRCALEVENSGEVRANKIIRIIQECGLGIHDISRTELNPEGLPRFNMPYELGLFIGCAVFGGGPHNNKTALILDKDKHRYAKYISDIAGQDIQDHGGDVATLIHKVRNWLATQTKGTHIPGGDAIHHRFNNFCAELPATCAKLKLSEPDLDNYRDYCNCVTEWLIEKSGAGRP